MTSLPSWVSWKPNRLITFHKSVAKTQRLCAKGHAKAEEDTGGARVDETG